MRAARRLAAMAVAGGVVVTAACSSGPSTPPPRITQAPSPEGTPAASQAGALAVGQADYPAPDDAIYVDGLSGDDKSTGASASPLRSIQAAVDRAAAGQTVVIRPGIYHETVYVNTPLTLQNEPGAEVWLDGSEPIASWQWDDETWSAPLPAVLDRIIGPDGGDPYVSDEHPAAAEPEMLFRDGQQLRQVLHRKEVDADSFYADRRRQRLHIGGGADGPGGGDSHDWRTASLAQAIVASAPDVTIRGIGVRRYGNSVGTHGAVYLARKGNLLENVVVEDVASTGVSFYSDANQGSGSALRTTIRRAGLMGIGATVADGLRIREVFVEEANYERFNATPNSAGIKITSSRDVVVESSVFRNSRGTTAIWIDESVVGFGVFHNIVENNGVTGISAELSSHGRIVDNVVADHEFGVVLYSAGSIDVVDNHILRNGTIDLDLRQDDRRQDDARAAGHDPRYPPGDPTNPWLVTDVNISCNILGPGPAVARLRAVDTATGIPADEMNITVNATTFVLNNGETVAALWGTGPPDQTRPVTDPTALPTDPALAPNRQSRRDVRAIPGCGTVGAASG